MPLITPAFARYVDAARSGRTALWRTLLIAVVEEVGTIAVGLAGAVVLAVAMGMATLDDGFSPAEVAGILSSTPTVAVLFGGIALTWPILWALVPLLQRRRLSTVLGLDGRLHADDFLRGAAALLLALSPTLALTAALGGIVPGQVEVSEYVIWVVPMLALILAQSSAEELFFRGFLTQSLAARFRRPHVWIVYPTLLFVFLHFESSQSWFDNLLRAVWYATFSLLALLAVVRSGGLGAAMGIHFANNVYAVLLVGELGSGPQVAPWAASPDAVSNGALNAVIVVASCAGFFAIAAGALCHPRSPLCLRPREPAEPSSPAAPAYI